MSQPPDLGSESLGSGSATQPGIGLVAALPSKQQECPDECFQEGSETRLNFSFSLALLFFSQTGPSMGNFPRTTPLLFHRDVCPLRTLWVVFLKARIFERLSLTPRKIWHNSALRVVYFMCVLSLRNPSMQHTSVASHNAADRKSYIFALFDAERCRHCTSWFNWKRSWFRLLQLSMMKSYFDSVQQGESIHAI